MQILQLTLTGLVSYILGQYLINIEQIAGDGFNIYNFLINPIIELETEEENKFALKNSASSLIIPVLLIFFTYVYYGFTVIRKGNPSELRAQEYRLRKTENILVNQLLDATENDKLIFLSLQNNLVYIAYIENVFMNLKTDKRDVKILPIESGYRCKYSKSVFLNTLYLDYYEGLKQKIENAEDEFNQAKNQAKNDRLTVNHLSDPDQKITQIRNQRKALENKKTNFIKIKSVLNDFGFVIPIENIQSIAYWNAGLHNRRISKNNMFKPNINELFQQTN